MAWFRHPVSGQEFEAVGVWEELARRNGCVEIPPPPAVSSEGDERAPDDGSDRGQNPRPRGRQRA
ncbi:hypothetical protein HRbin27_00060 [bacterium HR27]|nr:hypothetical protein HRbin27_00060 [bacterium HR27]